MTLYFNANVWTGSDFMDELEIGPSLGKSTVSDKPRRSKEREESGRLTGRVKAYNITRGFGFVNCGGRDGEDYFFHCTALSPGLEYVIKGEIVQFEITTGRDGRTIAENIKLAG